MCQPLNRLSCTLCTLGFVCHPTLFWRAATLLLGRDNAGLILRLDSPVFALLVVSLP